MTTTIPADWDITDPGTWTLRTTVDAHTGYHHTGMVMREYREITHRARDLDYGDVIEPTEEHAQWWAEVLTALHAADVAIAEASPEEITAAAASLGIAAQPDGSYDLRDVDYDDLEQAADHARRIVAALAQAHTEDHVATDSQASADHNPR